MSATLTPDFRDGRIRAANRDPLPLDARPPAKEGTGGEERAAAEKGSRTVSLADEEEVKKVLVSSVMGLWEVVNDLTRLRPSKKDRYLVSIFGSARVPKDSWVYKEVAGLARALTAMGCDIVTGGGPGLMQAANEGAARAGGRGRGKSVGRARQPCRSSRASTPSWSRRSSTARSSPACTSSC